MLSRREFDELIQRLGDGCEDWSLHATNKAAVIVPLLFEGEQLRGILMIRRTNNGRHGGQISFPGGKREDSETPIETARREFLEEIGIIPPMQLGYLGTFNTTTSEYEVKAFVGACDFSVLNSLVPDPVEVLHPLVLKPENLAQPWKQGVWGLSERILQFFQEMAHNR